MAHQFTVKANINGVSIDEFKRLVSDISMHEAVCRRIPAQNMEILISPTHLNTSGKLQSARAPSIIITSIIKHDSRGDEKDELRTSLGLIVYLSYHSTLEAISPPRSLSIFSGNDHISRNYIHRGTNSV